MRIDHHAYHRAVRVAAIGLALQAAIGLTLLIFGRTASDLALTVASAPVLIGLLPWLGLLIVYHQHHLERLEALEEDEFAQTRAAPDDAGSFYRETRVAARRLELMHRWVMPGLSLVHVILHAGLGALLFMALDTIRREEPLRTFHLTTQIGWAISITLAFTAVAFIFSRFVAGMAKQPAWQNLRAGAGIMVANALVLLAIAVGLGVRFFGNDDVTRWVASFGIPVFMWLLAGETLLLFFLGLYQPRVAGQAPRPAFDSRLMSLLAVPDSIVRGINDAINYQFGFEITSSWGYRLLIRSFLWLIGLGILVSLALNCLVVVEPTEQAVRVARGRITEERVLGSGLAWKLPWPFERVERYPVTEVRTLHLTGRRLRDRGAILWSDDLGQAYDRPLEPFMVTAGRAEPEPAAATPAPGAGTDQEVTPSEARAAGSTSLVDAELVLRYRIRPDDGLLEWLRFSSDEPIRRSNRTVREQMLRSIALREITQQMSRLSIDDVLARRRDELPRLFSSAVQRAFDRARAGTEVLAVDVLLVRPAGEASSAFEEKTVAAQQRVQAIEAARRQVEIGYTELVGDPRLVEPLVREIDAWRRAQDAAYAAEAADERDRLQDDADQRRARIQRILVDGGGEMGRRIMDAERDRWVKVMDSRAQAMRLAGEVAPFRTAPALYREREMLRLYSWSLPLRRKLVLGIDPSRIALDVDIKDINPLFDISDAIAQDKGPLE